MPLLDTTLAFYLASRAWGNLKQFDGIHYQCGKGEEAKSYNWFKYDRVYFPNPPALNRRFKRAICCIDEYQFVSDKRQVIKMVLFYLHNVSQALITSSPELMKTEDVMKLCLAAGASDAKRVGESATVIWKI